MLAAVAALGGAVLTAAPAAAHGELVMPESVPVEGARIGEAMDELSLVFTETPASFAWFAVTAPDGTRVDDGWSHGQPFPLDTPVQEYSLVDDVWEPVYYSTGFPVEVRVAHWPATGDYTVTYASVASDGDVVSGAYAFAYDGATTEAPAGWTPPTDEPDPQLELTDDPVGAAAPAPVGSGAATGAAVEPEPEDGPGLQPAVYVVVGLLVLGAVAAVVVVGRRGGRGPAPAGGRTGRSGNPAVRGGGPGRSRGTAAPTSRR